MELKITNDEGGADRRRLERVRLPEPLDGTIGSVPMRVLEVGLLGARIEVRKSIEMSVTTEISFQWRDEAIRVMGRVVRIELDSALSEVVGETIYQAGLEFLEFVGESAEGLTRLITHYVTQALELQKANARGEQSDWDRISSLTATNRKAHGGHPDLFLSCRLLDNGSWQKSKILKPNQPRVGFTVRADAPEEEVELLCKTYESSDETGRQLIRICAELSLVDETELPPNLAL